MRKGFALTELLLSIGILAILMGLGTVVFSNWAHQDRVTVEVRKLVNLINEARSKTLAGYTLGGSSALNFGLYFQNDRYFLFPGTSFNPDDAGNQEFLLPSSVKLSTIELVNDSLVFEKISGEVRNFDPVQNYLIVGDTSANVEKKISVNQLGTVMVEEF